jgi:hypothetical protein
MTGLAPGVLECPGLSFATGIGGSIRYLFVHIAPIVNFNNLNGEYIIFNRVDDTVDTYPDTVRIFRACKFYAAGGTGVIR